MERKQRSSLRRARYVTAALMLCAALTGCDLPVKVVGGIPDPQDTVATFFDSVCAGDFETADACLMDSSVEMKQPPADDFSASLMTYLQQSYAWEPAGEPETDVTEARQNVNFRHLDPVLLSDDLRKTCASLGKKYLRTQDEAHTEMNNGVCSLTSDGAQAVAVEALDSIMSDPEQYYTTDAYEISLKLEGNSWKILMTDELFDAIAGKYTA